MSIAAIFHRLPTGPGTDRELLRRFTDSRDEAAFSALVHRYGRMMFATCLRVLSHRADAEDAYQSAFLVFARRAGAIRSDEKLAGWLHTVAVRSATEVRRMRDRRRVAEAKGSRASGVPAGEDTPFEQAELATVLDEELAKLPDHYRLAVVLCELNGVSRKVAAKELGIAEGTLSSRLAKARKLLADRLTGRGFAGVSAATLTAALASAAVARIPVAVGALALSEGVLNVTIQSVADTVVKAMFATKLKAGALVAVLMALTGGAVWTTAAGGGPGGEPPPAGAKADTPAALVARLGSREYAEREAAQKQLRAMGTAALPAVRVGLTVPNPEVGRRCEALIGAIHKDDLDRFVAAFRKDKEYARPFDHPVWVRWAEVVGTTRGCRELFDELLLVPDAADILDAVRRKPDTAKDVYRAEMLKWYGVAQKRCNGAVKGGNLVPSHGYSTGESAFLAYLATFPGAWAEPSDDKLSGAECCPIGYLLSVRDYRPGLADLTGPNGTIRIRVPTTEADKWRALRIDSAAKWLFLKVIATRAHPQTLAYLLRWTGRLKAEDNIDPARAIFANEKLPATTRARCLNTFVDNDAVDLLPAVAKLQDDKTLLDRATDEEEIEFSVQVRDHAVATQLLLHKQDLFDYGFPKVKKGTHLFMQTGGWIQSFPDDASREAMHAKARAFLAKAGKPEKRKEYGDPVARALVEQLGDPSLAKRDAAEKALRALGEKAGRTLYSNQGRANPEIAERSYRLWAELVEARKKQPPKKTAPEPKK